MLDSVSAVPPAVPELTTASAGGLNWVLDENVIGPSDPSPKRSVEPPAALTGCSCAPFHVAIAAMRPSKATPSTSFRILAMRMPPFAEQGDGRALQQRDG